MNGFLIPPIKGDIFEEEGPWKRLEVDGEGSVLRGALDFAVDVGVEG